VLLTDTPTYKGAEQGTLYCIFTQTATQFGSNTVTGLAEFLLQASASLNMTSAPSGHNVVATAHGLVANSGYDILFAPYACGNTASICGTIVGAILTNNNGAGAGTFTVPSTIQTASGSQAVSSGQSYSVQLQPVGQTYIALASPPIFTPGSVSTTSCNTTSCLTASGGSSSTTVGINKAVQTSFTNTSNAPITAIVYGVVHNAAGQTVYYTTATITAAAGGSVTAYDIIAGLPSGTYSVTIFAVSTSGTAISTTSTATVTI
jgi:hypothetical protein